MGSQDAPAKILVEAVLRAVAEQRRSELRPHVDPDELVDYYAGTLSEEAAERLRDHLALCPECAGRLLDLEAFHAASLGGALDADAQASWRALVPRLLEGSEKAPPVRCPRRSGLPALPWALAAALLLALLGTSMNLQSAARELEQPQVEAAVMYLTPVGCSR